MPLHTVAAAAAQGAEVAHRAKSSALQAERRAEAGAHAHAVHYLGVARALAAAEGGLLLPLALDLLLGSYLRCLRVPPHANPAADVLLGCGIHLACADDFRGGSVAVAAARLSPDGQRLASLHADGVLFVWDVASRQQLLRIGTRPSCQLLAAPGPDPGRAALFAFSPDSRWLLHQYATTEKPSTLVAWEFQDNADRPFSPTVMPPSFLGAADEWVAALAFSPLQHSTLAACTAGAQGLTLRLADIDSQRLVAQCHIPCSGGPIGDEAVVLLAWSADASRLAASIGGNALFIWAVHSGQLELLQQGVLARTGKLLNADLPSPRQYPPPIRQWEALQPLGLCFGPSHQLGVAFQHRYAFEVDVGQLKDAADVRLVPDEEGRFARRDLHLFTLAAPGADGEYRVVGRETWEFHPVGDGALHRVPPPLAVDRSGALFFHPDTGALSAAVPVQTPDTKPYVLYITHVPPHPAVTAATATGPQMEPAVFHLPLATHLGPPSGSGALPVGLANGTVLLLDGPAPLHASAVRLSALPAPRTVYDARDWERRAFRLDRGYLEDMEAQARAAKEQARAAQRQQRADGEDGEGADEVAAEEEEEEELPERVRKAREKELQLRELQKEEFGVGWKMRINARPMRARGSTAAVLGLHLTQEGPLLLSTSDDASVRIYDIAGARLVRQMEGDTARQTFREVVFAEDGQLIAFRGTRTVDRLPPAQREAEEDGEEVEEEMEPEAVPPEEEEEEERGGGEEAPEEGEEDAEQLDAAAADLSSPEAERGVAEPDAEPVDGAAGLDPEAEHDPPPLPEPSEVTQDVLCIVDVGHGTRELLHISDHPLPGLAVLQLPDVWLALPMCRPHQANRATDKTPDDQDEEPVAESDPELAAMEEEEPKEEVAVPPSAVKDNEGEDGGDADSDSESDLGASEREERALAAALARAKAEEVERRRVVQERRRQEVQDSLQRQRLEQEALEKRRQEADARYAAAKEGTMDVHVVLLRVKDVLARVSQRQEEVEEEIEAEEGEGGEEVGTPVAPIDSLEAYPMKRTIHLNYWKHFAAQFDLKDPMEYRHLRFSFAVTGTPSRVLTAIAHRGAAFLFNEEGEAVLRWTVRQEGPAAIQDLVFSPDGTLLAICLEDAALICRVSDGARVSAWATAPGSRLRFGPQHLMMADAERIRILAGGTTLLHSFSVPQARPGAAHLCHLAAGGPSLWCSVLAGPLHSSGTLVVLQADKQGTSTAEALRAALLGTTGPADASLPAAPHSPQLDRVPACVVQRFVPSHGPTVIPISSSS